MRDRWRGRRARPRPSWRQARRQRARELMISDRCAGYCPRWQLSLVRCKGPSAERSLHNRPAPARARSNGSPHHRLAALGGNSSTVSNSAPRNNRPPLDVGGMGWHDSCMEVSVLRGQTEEVERFADHVIAERGVRHGRLVMVPVDVEEEKHAQGAAPEHRHLHVHVRDAG